MTIIIPKRLTPPAKPGSLLKGASAAQSRISPERSLNHLAMVRLLPCLYCGVDPAGECAHVNYSSAEFGRVNSLGKRSSDRWTVPLCRDDHQNAKHAQHKGNEEAFWLALGIDPYFAAKRLWEARGDLVRMNSVVHVIIAKRSLK